MPNVLPKAVEGFKKEDAAPVTCKMKSMRCLRFVDMLNSEDGENDKIVVLKRKQGSERIC